MKRCAASLLAGAVSSALAAWAGVPAGAGIVLLLPVLAVVVMRGDRR